MGPLGRVRLIQWLIPRYWIDKRTQESLEDAIERRLSEHFVEDQQFRDLLKEHLRSCRVRAAAEQDQLRQSVLFLPENWRVEREALDDEFVRRQVVTSLVDMYEYVEAGKEDVAHLEYRLLGKEVQVYEEYDRLRSEGTFRLGLALPLVALCLTFAYIDNLWWIAGLPVPVVFAYLGAGSFAEAERGLAAAVSSGRVELPSLGE